MKCTRMDSHGIAVRGRRLMAAAGLLAGLAGAALLGSCSKASRGSDPPAGGPGRGVPVTVAPAVAKDVPVLLETFGTVEAFSTVLVKTEVSGPLIKVHLRKGQDVKKGDVLFTIDPRSFQAALEQAQANLARDKIQEANARRDASRDVELLKKGIAAQSEYEKLQAQADALAATVQADAAVVETARLQLEHCTIRSPIDGRAGNLLVDEGNLVTASNETALVTIKQVSPIEVFFSVPQKELAAVRRYMAEGKLLVRASLPDEQECLEEGELTFVDNAVDRDAGTVQLGATFANRDRRLWPGQYVNVCLTLTVRSGAIVIPSRAVQAGRDGKYVFVILPDRTAQMRPVTVGASAGQEVVVEQGLKAGELVVTDGQFRLAPGAKADVKPDEKAASGPADSAPRVPRNGAAPADSAPASREAAS